MMASLEVDANQHCHSLCPPVWLKRFLLSTQPTMVPTLSPPAIIHTAEGNGLMIDSYPNKDQLLVITYMLVDYHTVYISHLLFIKLI